MVIGKEYVKQNSASENLGSVWGGLPGRQDFGSYLRCVEKASLCVVFSELQFVEKKAKLGSKFVNVIGFAVLGRARAPPVGCHSEQVIWRRQVRMVGDV